MEPQTEEQIETARVHRNWMALQAARVKRARDRLEAGEHRDVLISGEFGFVCVVQAEKEIRVDA